MRDDSERGGTVGADAARPGLVVIDFGQIFQGPYATMLMAEGRRRRDQDRAVHGENRRRVPRATGGDTTLPMAMLNQQQARVTLNLKSPARP